MLMYKILVTGGCGFIGSHLCERLAQDKNNDVYSLDNYSMGSVDNHVEYVTYIKGDTFDIDKAILDYYSPIVEQSGGGLSSSEDELFTSVATI